MRNLFRSCLLLLCVVAFPLTAQANQVGIAGEYNAFLLGSISIFSTDIEGRAAAGGEGYFGDSGGPEDGFAASGQLQMEMGGPSFKIELASDYGYQHSDVRRSVYSPVFPNAMPEIFDAFDFADPSVVSGRRNVSTVAPQALFLMNHLFVLEQSRMAAERLLSESPHDTDSRIDWAYRWSLGSLPSDTERRATAAFLSPADKNPSTDGAVTLWAELFQSLFASIDFRYVE